MRSTFTSIFGIRRLEAVGYIAVSRHDSEKENDFFFDGRGSNMSIFSDFFAFLPRLCRSHVDYVVNSTAILLHSMTELYSWRHLLLWYPIALHWSARAKCVTTRLFNIIVIISGILCSKYRSDRWARKICAELEVSKWL